jgi:hypothetical protein
VQTLSGLGTIDEPKRIEPDITYRVALDEGEAAFIAPPVAANLLVVLDLRSSASRRTNLQGALSILDADGSMIQPNVIAFNEIDYGYRKTKMISFGRKPPTVRLKLGNGSQSNVYWLTVFTTTRVPLVPFCGQATPRSLKVGAPQSGNIDPGEDLFYVTMLKKGTYKVIVDLTNAPRKQTNIIAYFAVTDALGGNQETVIGFNEIDYAFRKVGAVTLKSDGPRIFRLQNQNTPSTYSIRLVPEGESSFQ